jgi:hypothetical protein
LGRHFKANVVGADVLQAIRHDPHGQIGMIALAAQVTEIEVAEFSAHDLLGGIGSGFVGEMAMPPEDALFKAPRTMRAILQQLDVVVRFENENVCGANAIKHVARRVAKVG